MDYTIVRYIHITTVCLSIAGFLLRFIGVQMGAGWVSSKAARTLPHINDTVLLASAITLAVILDINPAQQSWLFAKIAALLIYISFGLFALKPQCHPTVRIVCGLLAVLVYSYIVSVAITKNVAGWLSAANY